MTTNHVTVYDLAVYEKAPDYFKVRIEIEVERLRGDHVARAVDVPRDEVGRADLLCEGEATSGSRGCCISSTAPRFRGSRQVLKRCLRPQVCPAGRRTSL